MIKYASIKKLIPEDWNAATFTIKSFNADGDELQINAADGTMYKKPAVMVTFPNFKTDVGTEASIAIMFN